MKLKQLLQNPEIPSLPAAVIRLLSLIENDAPISEITKIILLDPGLSMRTLELANSAWYKREKSIAKIGDAITVMGISALYQLIFSASVTRVFLNIETELVDMKTFWQQSARMATTAQSISSQIEHDSPISCFTCGLVAYIGKLVLYTTAPYFAQQILTRSKQDALPQHQVEMDLLGYDHAEIGAELMKKWNVPESLFEPVRYYIHPESAIEKYRDKSCILNIAHYLQYTYARNIGLTDPLGPINEFSMNHLSIDTQTLPSFARNAEVLYADAINIFNL